MERENRNLIIIWIYLWFEKRKNGYYYIGNILKKIDNKVNLIVLIYYLKRNKIIKIKKKSDLRVYVLFVKIEKIIIFFNEWNKFYFFIEILKVKILEEKFILCIKIFEFIFICRIILML